MTMEANSTLKSDGNTPKDDGDSDKPSSSSSSAQESKNCECNICFEAAKDAVVSFCGHLFCWPCLHYWLETQGGRSSFCPVCKAAISKDKVIPLFGRGETKGVDPRKKKVPPRPKAQRTEAYNSTYQEYHNGSEFGNPAGGGVQFSFGLGVFPFTFFGVDFRNNLFRNRDENGMNGAYSSDMVFIIMALLFILWLCLI